MINGIDRLQNTNYNKYEFIKNNDAYFSELLNLKLGVEPDYENIFKKASDKYGIPENLLKAVAKAESSFDKDAVSSAGAMGMMQLMPNTAKYLGVNNPFDPEENIMGGAKYLKELSNKYNGDIKLTLAAYNAGSGNVSKYGGIPPFKETQNYIKKIMGYLNSDFSFDIDNRISEIKNNDEDTVLKLFRSLIGFKDYTNEDYLFFVKLMKANLSTFSMFYEEKQNENSMQNIYAMFNGIKNK